MIDGEHGPTCALDGGQERTEIVGGRGAESKLRPWPAVDGFSEAAPRRVIAVRLLRVRRVGNDVIDGANERQDLAVVRVVDRDAAPVVENAALPIRQTRDFLEIRL